MTANPYNTDLDRNPANHQPLTPLTFLERAATVSPDHAAIIHGKLRRNYATFYARSRQLASALRAGSVGLRRHDFRFHAAVQKVAVGPQRTPCLGKVLSDECEPGSFFHQPQSVRLRRGRATR
jgi:hypothetical protein